MSVGDRLVIRGGTVVGPSGLLEGADVGIADGRITAVQSGLAAAGAEVLDATDHLVAAGCIDLHIHGAAGALFEAGEVGAAAQICGALARCGTTGILATIAALPADRLRRAVEAVAQSMHGAVGARILGIHLEGPYLSPACAGAQNPEWMRAPSLDEVETLQRLSGGAVRLVTVAPELPGAIDFIAALRARGIAVSLGHSAADGDTVGRAVTAGATHVTHLFNAMGAWHHRSPGLIGAALIDDRLTVELICDGEHVNPSAIDLALRCKPHGRVALVSDAVAACAPGDGELELFGTPCVAGRAVRVKATGQLAGSCLTLDAALRHVRDWCPRLPLPQLLDMATAAPARVLVATAEVGVLAAGRCADVIVLTAKLEVAATVCGGRIVHRAR